LRPAASGGTQSSRAKEPNACDQDNGDLDSCEAVGGPKRFPRAFVFDRVPQPALPHAEVHDNFKHWNNAAMASASIVPPPLELFYSYAHTDEDLRAKLEKHLAALQRVQLISGWSDRKILPGTEWAAEIQAAMERAGIILLLISADFLASEYCYNIELPFALKRHQAGSAIVIPVLLRPVEWKDTPFAALQALPDGARAVTLWPNQDEAFAEIAARLRERIYAQRLAATTPATGHVFEPITLTQERVLDAAVASRILLSEPADVVTMVRTVDSNGLKAILRLDASYNIPPENVQSKPFEVEFPKNANGQLLPAALELLLESPGCDPPRQSRKLRVPPTGDSDVCVFLLTPLKAGRLMLNLEVRYEDVEVGSRLLVTEAGPLVPAASLYSLVSMPLTSTAAWVASLPIQKVFAPSPWPSAPQATMAGGAVTGASPSFPREPVTKAGPRPTGPVISMAAAASTRKRSWIARPVMATVASAAALVVIGGVLLTTRPKSPAPVDVATGSSPTTAAPPPSTIPAPPPVATPAPSSGHSGAGGSAHGVEAVTALRPSPQAVAPAAQASLDVALAAIQRGDYRLAVGSFTRAIGQDPRNSELYWRRAEVYRDLREPALALRDLDRSIELDPQAYYPHLLKAEILSASGLSQRAIQEYQFAAASPSGSARAKEFAAKRAEELAVKQAH